ncbi:MAG: OmpA family protein [Rhodospirillales bacterium]
MGVPVKPNPEEEKEDWLVTYADAITLLMCFFVMMLTFAEFDIPAFEEAAAAIKEKIGSDDNASPTEKLKIDLEDVVFQMQADRAVQVTKDSKGVVIELSSGAFYKPGSAELREEAVPYLEKIAQTISAPRYATYNVRLEGHTDDEPISTDRFPSNWELSTGRAATVVRYFAENDFVDPLKMSATGYADQKPKVPNRTEDGTPIPENQATNRRTAIRVTAMSLKEREVWYQHLAVKRAEAEAKKQAEAQQGEQGAAPVEGQPLQEGQVPPEGQIPTEGQVPAPAQQ